MIDVCARIQSGEMAVLVLSDLANVRRPYWWPNLAVESEKKDVI